MKKKYTVKDHYGMKEIKFIAAGNRIKIRIAPKPFSAIENLDEYVDRLIEHVEESNMPDTFPDIDESSEIPEVITKISGSALRG